jgi:putative N6-adenine-specific DNA methylase
MKALAITYKGMEDVTAREISELIKPSSLQQLQAAVMFDFEKFEDLCLLCYKSQSAIKILYLFDNFKIFSLTDLKLEKTDMIDSSVTFASRCIRLGEHGFSSKDIETKVGEIINKLTSAKVNLKNPDIPVLTYIYDDDCYIGIDWAGLDLSKREYRIYTNPISLKGNIAYALVRIADYQKNDTIIDPFCGSGEIPIEAAMFITNFPVNFHSKTKFAFTKFKIFEKFDFDKFFEKIDSKIKKIKPDLYAYDAQQRNLKAAEKNAKIAGILKQISFSRTELEWLDVKFKKREINKIITRPPELSKQVKKDKIEKLYKELFYQADHVLHKKGLLVCILRDALLLKKEAVKQKFKILGEREIIHGKEALKVLVFGR